MTHRNPNKHRDESPGDYITHPPSNDVAKRLMELSDDHVNTIPRPVIDAMEKAIREIESLDWWRRTVIKAAQQSTEKLGVDPEQFEAAIAVAGLIYSERENANRLAQALAPYLPKPDVEWPC